VLEVGRGRRGRGSVPAAWARLRGAGTLRALSPNRTARPEARRRPLRRPPSEPGASDPGVLAPAECRAARSRSGVAANDCGPPRWTGTSVRSVPSVGGPPCCPSRCTPQTATAAAALPRAPGCAPPGLPAGSRPAAVPASSATPVLRSEVDRQPLAALLPPPGQRLASPAVGHPRPEAVFRDAPLVPRTIRRIHANVPPSEPAKLSDPPSEVKVDFSTSDPYNRLPLRTPYLS
jgi:hypothetical protein